MKMLMERSKRAHRGNPWTPLEMNGVISSRYPSVETFREGVKILKIQEYMKKG